MYSPGLAVIQLALKHEAFNVGVLGKNLSSTGAGRSTTNNSDLVLGTESWN